MMKKHLYGYRIEIYRQSQGLLTQMDQMTLKQAEAVYKELTQAIFEDITIKVFYKQDCLKDSSQVARTGA